MSWALLRTLLPFLRPYRRRYAFGFAILLANVAVFVAMPFILKLAIDALRQSRPAPVLLHLALWLVAAVSVRALLTFWQRRILIGLSRSVEYDLRHALLAHLERLSLGWFQSIRTGDIMARATNDLNAVRNMLGPGIMYSANAVVLFLAVFAILFHIELRLALIVVLPLPLISLAVQWFGKRIHERFERIQAMFADVATKVEENLAGLRVIRAFAREQAEIDDFDRLNRDYVGRNLRLIALSGAFDPLLQLLLGLAFVLVLWLGGRAVLAGQLSLGGFVAFNAYMMQLSFPVIAMGWVINLVQRGSASLARLRELLHEPPAIADGPETDFSIPALQGEIAFRHLSFGYESDRPILRDLCLTIPAGATVALVGPTGAGKTTLAQLIPRLYAAPAGSLLIDGIPIERIPLRLLRENIGLVPQETFLFSDTMRANIAFGDPAASDDAVHEAAAAAALTADVASFPEGFLTRIGERGLTLSGGQKQRTALARALLMRPRILILDDALASVDAATETEILDRLETFRQGRTTLIVSHRISAVRNADRIVVLDRGCIVEQGTHSELIGRGGAYAELYEKQLLEEELAVVE